VGIKDGNIGVNSDGQRAQFFVLEYAGRLRGEPGDESIQAYLAAGHVHRANYLLQQFNSTSALQKGTEQATNTDKTANECASNWLTKLLCSPINVAKKALSVAGEFVGTVISMWKFMMGMSGDFFFTGFTNPMMPGSASAGMYYFLIREVSDLAPFVILITVATVFEIILTVTMYRDVSLLFGGEAELIGLTKVI
jgi:hypothetical protein